MTSAIECQTQMLTPFISNEHGLASSRVLSELIAIPYITVTVTVTVIYISCTYGIHRP